MRRTLTELKSPPYERLVAYYVAYSESDYYNDRSQVMQDGKSRTLGMFQQSPDRDRWHNPTDIATATKDFIREFRRTSPVGDPTVDAHKVQEWYIPKGTDFWTSRETLNYTSRLGVVKDIMADPNYFTNRKK